MSDELIFRFRAHRYRVTVFDSLPPDTVLEQKFQVEVLRLRLRTDELKIRATTPETKAALFESRMVF